MAENVNSISGRIGLDTTEFKANISALNRDINIAKAEFVAVAAGMDDWTNSAEGLNAKMASLTTISEKQWDKLHALRKAYIDVAAEKGESSKAAQDLQLKILKEEAAYNATEKEIRRTNEALDAFGKETDSAGEKTSKFGDHLEGIKGRLKDLGGDIAKAAVAGVAAVGAAVVGAAAGAFKLATEAGESADNLLTLSAKTGIAVEELQKMEYASRFVDVELETMTGSMAKLTKSMDGNNAGFQTLGVSVRDAQGGLRDAKTVWAETIDALGNVANETERDALAMQIFGKSAMELNPLIKASGEELRRLGEEAQSMGVILSEEAVGQAGKFDDMMQRLQASGKALASNIGIAVMPAIESVVSAANSMVPAIIEAIKTGNWDEAAVKLKEGLGELVKKAAESLPGIAQAAGAILTTLVSTLAESIPLVLPELVKVTVDIVKSLVDTLIDSAPLLVQAVVTGMTEMIKGILDILPKILELGMLLIAELAKGIGDALPELLPAVYECLYALITAFFEGLPQFVEAGAALILGFVKGVINSIPVIIEGILTAIPAMITAFVEVLISLVKAIPEAIVVIVAALPQLITGIIEGIMKALPQIVQAGVDLFVSLVRALPEIITQIVKIIPNIITSIIDTLTKSLPLIIQAGIQLFVALVKAAPTIIIEIVKAIPAIISAIVNGFLQGIGQMIQAGRDLIGGVWRGIADSANWLWEQVKGFFGNLIAKIKNLLGIHSPSDVMAELVGKPMGLGIAEGFAKGLDLGGVSIEAALNGAMSKIQSQIAQAAKAKQSAVQARAEEIWAEIARRGAEMQGLQPGQQPGVMNEYTYIFNSPKAIDEREARSLLLAMEQLAAARQGI